MLDTGWTFKVPQFDFLNNLFVILRCLAFSMTGFGAWLIHTVSEISYKNTFLMRAEYSGLRGNYYNYRHHHYVLLPVAFLTYASKPRDCCEILLYNKYYYIRNTINIMKNYYIYITIYIIACVCVCGDGLRIQFVTTPWHAEGVLRSN